jgi:vacuolar protein sorting-associated protein 13A/C
MAFLKNLASSVLNSLLSNYFESFENKVVSFSLGGELELTELVIKRNILDNLHLPLKIKFGSVGRLKLVVPWTDLSKKPTTVMLDDVYLIAESNTNNKVIFV